jgi:hypothetical protein
MEDNSNFTPVQKANSIIWFIESGDTHAVQNLFRKKYCAHHPHWPVPSKEEIHHWLNTFRNTGSIADQEDENLDDDEMIENTTTTCSKPFFSSLIAKCQDFNTVELPEYQIFHPYQLLLTKKFSSADAKERVDFANKELDRLRLHPDLLHNLWFTGEAAFYTNGHIESHNMRYISDENQEPHSKDSRVIVWAGLSSEILLGPYFLIGDINTAYHQVLREFFVDMHKKIGGHGRSIFMHDDAPPHRKFDVQKYFEKEVPYHWIGTGSHYANFPRNSPDLNPLNYFLWGFIKKIVYRTPILSDDVKTLKNRITRAFKKATVEMLQEAVVDYKVRLEHVVVWNGELVAVSVDDNAIHTQKHIKSRFYECLFDSDVE